MSIEIPNDVDAAKLENGESSCYNSGMNRIAVYVIGTSKGPFKIGISADPDKRAKELQTGCPVPIRVIYLRECRSREEASDIERAAHRLLARKRGAGEWFFCRLEEASGAITVAAAILRALRRAAQDEDYIQSHVVLGNPSPVLELLTAVEFGECRTTARGRVHDIGAKTFNRDGLEGMVRLLLKVQRLSVTKRAAHVSEVWHGIGGWVHGEEASQKPAA